MLSGEHVVRAPDILSSYCAGDVGKYAPENMILERRENEARQAKKRLPSTLSDVHCERRLAKTPCTVVRIPPTIRHPARQPCPSRSACARYLSLCSMACDRCPGRVMMRRVSSRVTVKKRLDSFPLPLPYPHQPQFCKHIVTISFRGQDQRTV